MNKRTPLISTVNCNLLFLFATNPEKRLITKSYLGLNELPKTVPNLKIHGLQYSSIFLIIVFSIKAFSFAYTDNGNIFEFSVNISLFLFAP